MKQAPEQTAYETAWADEIVKLQRLERRFLGAQYVEPAAELGGLLGALLQTRRELRREALSSSRRGRVPA